MSRRSVLTVLALLSVFLAGALAGVAVVRFTGWWESPPQAEQERSPERPGDLGWRGSGDGDEDPVYEITDYLDQELSLRPEQEDRVREILERRSQQARAIFQESRRRFLEHYDSTTEEVRRVLDPRQTERYEQILEEFEARGRVRMENDR